MTPQIPQNWPNRAFSQRQPAADVDWHVQIAGAEGLPVVLLLHGTGGSTHEWADVIPRLTLQARIVAPDLPGHAFSTIRPQVAGGTTRPATDPLSLSGMAAAVGDLMQRLGMRPDLIIGHSAGAAVALRMTLDGLAAPRAIIGFNPALIPPPDFWVDILAPFASLLVESSWLARSAAWAAQQGGVVKSMLASSGATLTPEQVERYAQLFAMPAHCAAALGMMNKWNLPALVRDSAALAVPFTAYTGAKDRWVPEAALARHLERIPTSTLVSVPEVGHLLPEEAPTTAVEAILRALRAS